MDTPQALAKYIQDVTGVPPALGPIPKSKLAGLPLYLTRVFNLQKLTLFGHALVVAMVTSDDKIDLAQLSKHRDALAAKLGEEIVLVLPNLKSYERRRIIQKKIPLIAPGKQMYLPMLLVDLRESFSARPRPAAKALSWVAQAILLRHLLSRDIEDRPLAAVALSLGYSAMAVSQAVDELVAFRLSERIQRGKTKTIRFQSDHSTLWQTALPFMRSPVKKTHWVRTYDSKAVRALRAGMTALAESTSIVASPVQTLALGAKEFRNAVKAGHIQTCLIEEDAAAIFQAWAYAPGRLTDGRTVDSLSLYLSLRDDPDERVQIALEELVGNWK